MATKKRNRRTPEQMIADLQGEIERLKARAAQAQVKKDPALRHISGAVRALDKALKETKDKATREALTNARGTLVACLELNGAPVTRAATARVPRVSPAPEKVLAFLKKNPGSRSEAICEALATDSASLRPVLHELRDAGKIRVEGKARATSYKVV